MLSVDQILFVLWKRRRTFVATFALVLAGAAAVTFTLPERYESSSYLLVSSGRTSASDYEATQTNQVLSKTFAELLQTRNTADAVAGTLSFPVSGPALQSSVQIEPIAQSQLIRISAQADSAERARETADAYASVFVERVEDDAVGASTSVDIVVAERAALELDPVRPRPLLYLLIGTILALFAAAAAALLRNRLDQRLEIPDGVTELLGLPVLGRIPQRGARAERDAQLADAFRLVLANLTFANLGGRPGSLAVVSAGEGEGKSTCALNIARSATELGTRVLLVDADLRRPGLTKLLGEEAAPTPGFSSLLLTPERVRSELEDSDASLHFVAAGPIPPNPAGLLGSDGLTHFERVGKELYDLVIFDTPPLLVGADASLISTHSEGVILVVDPSRTRRAPLAQAVDQLRRAQTNILGIIVNRVSETSAGYYYTSDPDASGQEPLVELEAFSSAERSRGAA